MDERARRIREVSGLLHDMSHRLRTQAHRHLAELELTLPMAITLRILDEPAPMSELAERLACDASYMTGIADRLEARGLVERTSDPADRRVRLLQITPEGEAYRSHLGAALADATPMLERLTTDELETLASMLRKAVGSTET